MAAALTASGCPRMPSGVLSVLRTDLAQGFVRTAGAWAARKVEWIDSLPPTRRAAAAGGGAQLGRAVTIQPLEMGVAAVVGGAALRRASTTPPSMRLLSGGPRGAQLPSGDL